MKVAIQDAATLRALKPLELAAYLRVKGWKRECDLGGKGSLWLFQNDEGTEFDVTLPASRELRDYVLRVSEIIHALADVERRSELDVLRDIQTTTADLVRVRVPIREADNGTLPLDRAVTFVERSRDLFLAAACAALDKRPIFAKRKAQRAIDYLSQARMGQTERGSYVLTILSPVLPVLRPVQGTLLPVEPDEPYERAVTRTLMDALNALQEAAQGAAINRDMSPFQSAVTRGVSANLCDAVVGLASVSAEEGLDIRVSWSRTRPVDIAIPSKVFLGADSIPLIEEAARQFRESESWEDLEIEGFVTRLDRDPSATEGDVTVVANVDGQMRRIVVRLEHENYRRAIQAHDERRTVRCTGELGRVDEFDQAQGCRETDNGPEILGCLFAA